MAPNPPPIRISGCDHTGRQQQLPDAHRDAGMRKAHNVAEGEGGGSAEWAPVWRVGGVIGSRFNLCGFAHPATRRKVRGGLPLLREYRHALHIQYLMSDI